MKASLRDPTSTRTMLDIVGQMEGQKAALEKDYSLSILANRYHVHESTFVIKPSKIKHLFEKIYNEEWKDRCCWDARTNEILSIEIVGIVVL